MMLNKGSRVDMFASEAAAAMAASAKENGRNRMLTSYESNSRGGGRHAGRRHMPRNDSQAVSNF